MFNTSEGKKVRIDNMVVIKEGKVLNINDILEILSTLLVEVPGILLTI